MPIILPRILLYVSQIIVSLYLDRNQISFKLFHKSKLFESSWHLFQHYELSIKFTLFENFIFCPKIQLWFPVKFVDFFGVKISWKCCGFGLFSCWKLWFHEKNCQKKFGLKNSWKCWSFVKIEFLDKIWLFEVWNCIW